MFFTERWRCLCLLVVLWGHPSMGGWQGPNSVEYTKDISVTNVCEVLNATHSLQAETVCTDCVECVYTFWDPHSMLHIVKEDATWKSIALGKDTPQTLVLWDIYGGTFAVNESVVLPVTAAYGWNNLFGSKTTLETSQKYSLSVVFHKDVSAWDVYIENTKGCKFRLATSTYPRRLNVGYCSDLVPLHLWSLIGIEGDPDKTQCYVELATAITVKLSTPGTFSESRATVSFGACDPTEAVVYTGGNFTQVTGYISNNAFPQLIADNFATSNWNASNHIISQVVFEPLRVIGVCSFDNNKPTDTQCAPVQFSALASGLYYQTAGSYAPVANSTKTSSALSSTSILVIVIACVLFVGVVAYGVIVFY